MTSRRTIPAHRDRGGQDQKITTDNPSISIWSASEVLKGKVTTLGRRKESPWNPPRAGAHDGGAVESGRHGHFHEGPPEMGRQHRRRASQQTGKYGKKRRFGGGRAIWRTRLNGFTGRFLWNYAEEKTMSPPAVPMGS